VPPLVALEKIGRDDRETKGEDNDPEITEWTEAAASSGVGPPALYGRFSVKRPVIVAGPGDGRAHDQYRAAHRPPASRCSASWKRARPWRPLMKHRPDVVLVDAGEDSRLNALARMREATDHAPEGSCCFG